MKTYCGTFVNPRKKSRGLDYDIFGLCTVDNFGTGKIVAYESFSNEYELREKAPNDAVWLEKGEFMIPGFVDCHTHAPQYQNIGKGLEWPLLEWLEKVTFPTEASFAIKNSEDIQRITQIYRKMVKDYLRNGTTCVCYFGSIHLEANCVLVDEVIRAGQRAFIGKVCMDRNCPSSLQENPEVSLKDTTKFNDYIRKTSTTLVNPIITPRFAISCTEGLLSALGALAKKEDLMVTSHMSENRNEVEFIKTLFPKAKSYSSVYKDASLLGKRTIMAHCIHMTSEDYQNFAETETAIAHCPNSNFALSSGVADVRRMLDAGLRVGLGSDVSGGYSISMLDACRQAIIASKTIKFNKEFQEGCKDYKVVDAEESFYLATLGGAQALDLDDKIGSFEVGKYFDAIIIDTDVQENCTNSNQSVGKEENNFKNNFLKFILTGGQRNIKHVFVNGKVVIKSDV